MSNIVLKAKDWRSQNFDSLVLKNLSPGQFLVAPTNKAIIEFQNFFLQLKNHWSGSKTVCGFSNVLILKGIMTF